MAWLNVPEPVTEYEIRIQGTGTDVTRQIDVRQYSNSLFDNLRADTDHTITVVAVGDATRYIDSEPYTVTLRTLKLLETPANFSLSDSGGATIEVSWSLVDGARGYELVMYAGTDTDVEPYRHATLGAQKTAHAFTIEEAGLYTLSLIATTISASHSNSLPATLQTTRFAPVITRVARGIDFATTPVDTTWSIELHWEAVPMAIAYRLTAVAAENVDAFNASTTGFSYRFDGLQGYLYTLTVTAIFNTFEEGLQASTETYTTLFDVQPGVNSVTLSWQASVLDYYLQLRELAPGREYYLRLSIDDLLPDPTDILLSDQGYTTPYVLQPLTDYVLRIAWVDHEGRPIHVAAAPMGPRFEDTDRSILRFRTRNGLAAPTAAQDQPRGNNKQHYSQLARCARHSGYL